jgi:hypothetical protein
MLIFLRFPVYTDTETPTNAVMHVPAHGSPKDPLITEKKR